MTNFKNIVLSLIIIGILGTALSYVLTYEYYIGPITEKSGLKESVIDDFTATVCGGEKSFVNCGKVAKSKYSRFGKIPVSIFGMLFFLLIVFLGVFIVFVDERFKLNFLVLLFWLILLGSLLDIYLLFVSIFIIKAICSLCFSTYILIWIALILLIVYFRKTNQKFLNLIGEIKEILSHSNKKVVNKYLTIAILIWILSLGLAIGADKYLQYKRKIVHDKVEFKKIEEVLDKFANEEPVDLKVGDLLTLGKKDAPIQIVKFSDFMCPVCQKVAVVMDELVEENPDTVRVVFINFPLDIQCNPIMRRQLHPGACDIARGSICAARQKKFKEYYEFVIMRKFHQVEKSDLLSIASSSGMNVDLFDRCLSLKSTEDELFKQIDSGIDLGVNATPTIYINNKRFKIKPLKKILEKVIENELSIMKK